MLETLCGTTSSVPTTKGLAQPSSHLFPTESIQRSAQMYKVLIPQTPKSSWRGHSLPWQRPSASSISCNALLDPFFIPHSVHQVKHEDYFAPNQLKRNSRGLQRGILSRDPLTPSLSSPGGWNRGQIQPGVCSERASPCQLQPEL